MTWRFEIKLISVRKDPIRSLLHCFIIPSAPWTKYRQSTPRSPLASFLAPIVMGRYLLFQDQHCPFPLCINVASRWLVSNFTHRPLLAYSCIFFTQMWLLEAFLLNQVIQWSVGLSAPRNIEQPSLPLGYFNTMPKLATPSFPYRLSWCWLYLRQNSSF